MVTQRLGLGEHDIEQAANLLTKGEVVAFPTETVYGLGANALDSNAVDKIFKAKGRPSDNPLIVHIAHREQLQGLVQDIPPVAEKLMDAFWPGPLTLILQRAEGIPDSVTAGLSTVGVRMPDHQVALSIIAKSGKPIAAPSANRSGRPSPTAASHVWEDLQGKIAAVVDGGLTGIGVESTVVDATVNPPMILRPGGVTKEMLEQVIGTVEIDPDLLLAHGASGDGKGSEFPLGMAPRSPGMKYTHYAPKGEMWLVQGNVDKQVTAIQLLVDKAQAEGLTVGVLTTDEHATRYKADAVLSCGSRKAPETIAAGLYGALREFDHLGIERIYSETFPDEGIGLAIMNRLRKAAGNQYID